MTPETYVPNQINCYQCGAPLPVTQGSQFATCEFCGATNYVDKSGAVLHYAVKETISQDDATAALRRWMGGNQTVKDLDKKARITQTEYQLVPMWLVRVDRNGNEKVILEPAAATAAMEMTQMTIPAADLQPYDHGLDVNAVEPTVPINTLRKWLKENHGVSDKAIKSTSLVHIPIYVFRYAHDGRSYLATVDASSSKVYADIFPSKWETPYMAIGSLGCAAYFCAAFVPLIGFASGDFGGLGLGILIYAAIAAVIAIPIFVAATTIAAKV